MTTWTPPAAGPMRRPTSTTPKPQRLTCASCDPTGARPVGAEYDSATLFDELTTEHWGEAALSGLLPGWTAFEEPQLNEIARVQPRYLSNEGRLFFDSDDALVPRDINGTWDVYEYEPEGIGGLRPGRLQPVSCFQARP